jgi:hypothetical protein
VGGDFEEEAAVAASVDELVCGRLAQGEAAEYERTGVISNHLLAILALLTDKLDSIELLESALRNADDGCGTLQAIMWR